MSNDLGFVTQDQRLTPEEIVLDKTRRLTNRLIDHAFADSNTGDLVQINRREGTNQFKLTADHTDSHDQHRAKITIEIPAFLIDSLARRVIEEKEGEIRYYSIIMSHRSDPPCDQCYKRSFGPVSLHLKMMEENDLFLSFNTPEHDNNSWELSIPDPSAGCWTDNIWE